MRSNINTKEIHDFLNTTHPENLKMLKRCLGDGKWHWMFPDGWENTDQNRLVIYHGINARLMSIAVPRRRQ